MTAQNKLLEHLRQYSLLDALKHRRSRRFACGMETKTGPLAFKSQQPPYPLSESQVATLAFAACGITGHALGDLVYAPGQGGTMMAGSLGRTVSSADAVHSISVAVIDGRGTYLLKRPDQISPEAYPRLLCLTEQDQHLELYRESRELISPKKCTAPNHMPYNIDCNHRLLRIHPRPLRQVPRLFRALPNRRRLPSRTPRPRVLPQALPTRSPKPHPTRAHELVFGFLNPTAPCRT